MPSGTLPIAGEPRSWHGVTAPSSKRHCAVCASTRACSPAIGGPTVSADDAMHASLTPRSVSSAPSPRPAGGRASRRHGGLSTGRSRLPASPTLRRACPRECGVSLRERTRRPACSAISLRVCPGAPAPGSLFQAWPFPFHFSFISRRDAALMPSTIVLWLCIPERKSASKC